VSPLAPKSLAALPPLAGVRLATIAAGIRYRDRDDVLLAVLAQARRQREFSTVENGQLRSNGAEANLESGQPARSSPIAKCQCIHRRRRPGRGAPKVPLRSCRASIATQASVRGVDRGDWEPLPSHKITKIMATLSDAAPQAAGVPQRKHHDDRHVSQNGDCACNDRRSPRDHQWHCQGFRHDRARHGDAPAFVSRTRTFPRLCSRNFFRRAYGIRSTRLPSTATPRQTILFSSLPRGKVPPSDIAKAGDRRLGDFRRKFDALLLDLALQVVRDGEGAQKLIRIDVSGAESDESARRVGFAIANSPLVKTAIAGGDANWARVMASARR